MFHIDFPIIDEKSEESELYDLFLAKMKNMMLFGNVETQFYTHRIEYANGNYHCMPFLKFDRKEDAVMYNLSKI